MLDFKISAMKKVRLLKIIILCMLFSACIKDSDFSTPTIECVEPVITVTNTIQQVKEMYKFGGSTIIETDVVIEGYVVSSDESGNIYKTISIQDKPNNLAYRNQLFEISFKHVQIGKYCLSKCGRIQVKTFIRSLNKAHRHTWGQLYDGGGKSKKGKGGLGYTPYEDSDK